MVYTMPFAAPTAKPDRTVGIGALTVQQSVTQFARRTALNALLVAAPTPMAEATNVYPLPPASMLKSGKVAIPPDAATVLVPERVPPPGLVPRAIVTSPVKVGTMTPATSFTETRIGGVRVAPANVLVG